MTTSPHQTRRNDDPTDAPWPGDRLREFATRFDAQFERLLTPTSPAPERILQAVRYAALGPGKRLRPFLVVRSCELVEGNVADAWPVAVAVECVHAFSLVHDDLPAMDDDELRRGRRTCHVQFDEATAVLVGDVLIILAFEILARNVEDHALATRLIRELAEGAGWSGMIGGQMDDISGQAEPPELDRTVAIHERKTARLFRTACRMGVLIGRGADEAIDSIGRYGQSLGRAFQIADDLLDLTASTEMLGKRVGKDVAAHKQTFPRAVGMDESIAAARKLAGEALSALEPFGKAADDLRNLARYVIDRDY